MAKQASNGGEPAEETKPAEAAANQAPGIHVLGQYIKDLSFENPGAPNSLRPAGSNPSLDVNVNVNAKPIGENQFEVELKLDAAAKRGEDTLFVTEVVYGGLFQLRNVPQEHVHQIVLIECPRLLFPFARQILADATRQGGFPPLMIDPVDFAALYRQRAQQSAEAEAPKTA
ncbi:protein-export chaperone SecB [Afifella pfennigii]|uniref:protein-export chaperone SecB n=1 Tax=Afifella pfennigii TaxID=209897 RepID=UPI00047C4A14|nr:protein-export chaperone SecB [Afifella pfennigii]